MSSEERIAQWAAKIIIWIYHIFLWLLTNVIIDPLIAVFLYFKTNCYDWFLKVDRKDLQSVIRYIWVIIACFLVLFLIVDSWRWWYQKTERRINRQHYTQPVFEDYESEFRDFFLLYEQRWIASDCDFMKKVSTDLSMYTRYWRTEYEKYACPAYSQFNKIKMLPIEIYQPKQEWNILRISGTLLRVEIKNNQPRQLSPMNVEIRKDIVSWDWLRRLNPIGTSQDRAIEAKLKY